MANYYLIGILALITAACSSKKVIPVESHRDSVVIVKEKVIHLHDTILHEIPSQSASNVTPMGHSFLENDYAWSTADVDSAGVLRHVLETKNKQIPIPVTKDSVVRDSLVYRDRKIPVPYPVERDLSWWEKVSIDMMPVLLIVIVVENLFIWLRHRKK